MCLSSNDLKTSARLSKAASHCPPLPNGLTFGWQTVRDNGATASIWQGVSDMRVIRDASGRDVAYVPFYGPGNYTADAVFIAHSRQALPALIREWWRRYDQMLKRGVFVAALLPEEHLHHAATICSRASRAPWKTSWARSIDPGLLVSGQSLRIVTLGGCGDVCHVHPGGPDDGNADAQFIAYARQAIPRLVSDVTRMRRRLGLTNFDAVD